MYALISELRIGNVVFARTDGQPAFVPVVVTPSEFVRAVTGHRIFEPIPLDKNWLSSFGFKEDKERRFFEKNGVVVDYFPDDAIGFRVHGFEVDHVHNLMNLYYCLVGEEMADGDIVITI